jgi:hypothetical protein
MAATARCPRCGRTLPVDAFHKDRTRSTGRVSHCKDCKAGRVEAAPKGLVLVPKFPAPPEPSTEPDPPVAPVSTAPQSPPQPVSYGHYATTAERFIAALDPPAGDADALLVVALRDLAAQGDRLQLGSLDKTKELNTLTIALVRVMRELAGTRAAKSAAGSPAAPLPTKLDAFRAAL